MLKEDVKFAKDQYKLALAEYCRAKQKWHDANKVLMELQQQKAKIEHEINRHRLTISQLKDIITQRKHDYTEKQIHWKRLNTEYQFLCNQRNMIKKI